MRIHVLSDLHNEFEPFKPPEVDCDVVILAGDVGVGMKGLAWIHAALAGKTVLYVAGNHEYYGHALPVLTHKLKKGCEGSPIRLLECDTISLSGIRFLGCTLWSDFEVCGVLLWVHGHTHHCVDYRIGGTRILSNQRGYPDQPAGGFRPDLVLDVES